MRNEPIMLTKKHQITLVLFLFGPLFACWLIGIFFIVSAECRFPVLPFFIASISIRNLQVVSNWKLADSWQSPVMPWFSFQIHECLDCNSRLMKTQSYRSIIPRWHPLRNRIQRQWHWRIDISLRAYHHTCRSAPMQKFLGKRFLAPMVWRHQHINSPRWKLQHHF